MAKSATERKRDQRDRDKLSAKEKEVLANGCPWQFWAMGYTGHWAMVEADGRRDGRCLR